MNEGKKDRRDPIRTIKARNPVAKNASKAIGGGAAGAHKDKKKAAKHGDVKHKKAEMAESYESRLSRQLNELSIDSLKSYKAKRQVQQDAAKAATPNPRTGDKDWIDQAVRGINMNTAQRKINRKEKSVAEEMDIPADGTPEYDQFINRGGVNQKTPYDLGGADAYYGRQNDITKEYGFQKGSPEWDEYIQGYRDTHSNKDMRKDYGSSRSSVQPRRITKTGEAMNGITGPGMMRDPAMEDEGDKEGLPHLTPELAQHIASQIDSEGAHAIVKSVEWGDGAADELVEFIKAALLKLAGVNGMKEDSALTQHRKRSAQADADFAKREAERKKNPGSTLKPTLDTLEKRYSDNKDVDEGWKSNIAGAALAGAMALGGAGAAQAQSSGPNVVNPTTVIQQIQSGKIQNQNDLMSALGNASNKQAVWKVLQNTAGMQGSNDVNSIIGAIGHKNVAGSQQPVKSVNQSRSFVQNPSDNFEEGWTHDSLADELFEHERTYEEKLQNQLNKSLGK